MIVLLKFICITKRPNIISTKQGKSDMKMPRAVANSYASVFHLHMNKQQPSHNMSGDKNATYWHIAACLLFNLLLNERLAEVVWR
jgi:hypothetical protein